VLSFNAGSHVPRTAVVQDEGDIFAVKPIETLLRAQQRIVELASQAQITIGIVGGGPSSAELAGNILQLAKSKKIFVPRVKIFSGSSFMGRFPAVVRGMIMKSLVGRGIEILEGSRVKEVSTGRITTESGEIVDVDLVIMAIGVKPSSVISASGLGTGPDEGLLVNRFLQCPDYPELFGGGDCIYFADSPLDKVGVYAVRENPVLYHNLLAALEGRELQSFDPRGKYLLIFNLGEGIGVLSKSWLHFSGRLAFSIKDYIDRKFMKEFQAIEH